jgi:hypothetical protein
MYSPVQQSVLTPNPIYSQDVPLSIAERWKQENFANPTLRLPAGDTEIIGMDRIVKLIAKHIGK